jgi:hypothetical protein
MGMVLLQSFKRAQPPGALIIVGDLAGPIGFERSLLIARADFGQAISHARGPLEK